MSFLCVKPIIRLNKNNLKTESFAIRYRKPLISTGFWIGFKKTKWEIIVLLIG